jgi:integrase
VAKTVAKNVAKDSGIMYVVLRGSTFWFSRKLPEHAGQFMPMASGHQLVGKNGYLRFSLRTGNKRDAERMARRYAVEIDDTVEQLERARKSSSWPITPEDVRHAAATMQASLLAADDAVYQAALNATLSGHAIERLPDRETSLADALPPPSVMGDAELLHSLRELIPFYIYTTTGKTPTGPLDASYTPFVAAFRQVSAALRQRAEGKDAPTPPAPKSNRCDKTTMTWNGLLEYYWHNHRNLSGRTIALYKLAIHQLAAKADCPPAALTRKQVIEWRDLLMDGLAPKTALARHAAAKTVYRYSLRNEQLGERRDPFDAVTVDGAKSAKSSRQEFSLTALKEIFRDTPSIDEIPDSAGKHAAQWIPVLALFTGARREELAGLLIDEVGEADDIRYLYFKDNKLRKLKEDTCERMTPLHTEIIRLGFPAYVDAIRASGADRLFPGIVSSNGLTDWFTSYVKSKLGETDVMQDLHSFRHTFKTAARNAGINTELHNAITGHKTPGVGSQYGSTAGLERLKIEMDKIRYKGVVIMPPPLPTADEIKAISAGAERRRIIGKRRAARQKAKKAVSS